MLCIRCQPVLIAAPGAHARSGPPANGYLGSTPSSAGSERQAKKLIAVGKAFNAPSIETIESFEDSALYALSAPDVPQSVRAEAIDRAEAGEHITRSDAQRMVDEAIAADRCQEAGSRRLAAGSTASSGGLRRRPKNSLRSASYLIARQSKRSALAMIYPEPGRKGVKNLDISRSEQTTVGQARAVLSHSKALADDVLADRIPLFAAMKQIEEARQSQ
jgi:hypothetical protein